ncbi:MULTISPECIES: C40 family peptidase [Glycomyces]|uniref:Cell wall-associated NlpC family hydrolase n=2 Tax=Glycomyces TaxID=58113 RepID=A0A9X3PLA8_9ACTN|nr:NlpC/P60 family protein [Glycomyces lechevalierae]MDA1387519.1 NlpC/P60 family protein [Glycomyces lechevalierae]MDR7338695.1 cell wall-associated NlpC family hydrolase [Glycomyces lechevalierae]
MRTRRITAALAAAALLPVTATLFTTSAASAQSSEEIQDEIDQRHDDLEKVIEDYNAKREELDDANALIDEIEAQLPALEASTAAANEALDQYAASAYAGGDFAMVNSVLDGDPADFADRLMYLDSLSSSENAALQANLAQIQELEDRRAELQTLKDSADEILGQIEKQQDEIEAEIDDLEEDYDDAYAEEHPSQTEYDYEGSSAAVAFAVDQLGEPYVYGDAGPDSWDCSGLTQQAWAAAGVSLSHNAAMQWDETARISRDELQEGDLVFYNDLAHVGMYIGDGEIIHAPNSTTVVKIVDIDYGGSIVGYGRP